MNEKKINRLLLILMGFLCGRGAFFGITPFIIPMFIVIFYMKENTLGLLISMIIGGLTLYAGDGLLNFGIFDSGPFVMSDIETTATYFLSKYIVLIFLLLICLNIFEKSVRLSLKKENDTGKYFSESYRKNAAAGIIIGVLICIISFMWNIRIYDLPEASFRSVCEVIISVSAVPVFKRGIKVMIFKERERDKYNEELLGVITLVSVCMWGMPVTIGHALPWLVICGLYISWYTLFRFGAGYGMAVTGAAGVICAIKTENPEFVGSFFIIAIIVLAGRIVSDKRKTAVVLFATAACLITGLLYFDYLISADGLKIIGAAIAIFAATPRQLLSVRDGYINAEFNAETAIEMNRITAEKIRELSGAFKRIEYTLAGCGPSAARISLGEVGEMIGKFSDNLETAEPASVGKEDLLKLEMQKRGVMLTHLSSMQNEMNHKQYYITARTKNKKIMLSKDAAEVMSDVFGKPIRASENTPAIISENDKVITFEECAAYGCCYNVQRIKKYGSNVSGDNFSVKEHEDGRLIMMISDGMGSGSLASCESTLMIDTMEELMEAGFDPSYGISFSNACISEKNNGRSFTTFDMGVIDLYEGVLTQYKQGAAPTYIVHKGDEISVEVIRGTTLPIGVLAEAECDVVKTKLRDDDIIVMVSDGVTDDEEAMLAILKENTSDDCKDILDFIVSRILYYCKGRPDDDATIIVARLEENYKG